MNSAKCNITITKLRDENSRIVFTKSDKAMGNFPAKKNLVPISNVKNENIVKNKVPYDQLKNNKRKLSHSGKFSNTTFHSNNVKPNIAPDAGKDIFKTRNKRKKKSHSSAGIQEDIKNHLEQGRSYTYLHQSPNQITDKGRILSQSTNVGKSSDLDSQLKKNISHSETSNFCNTSIYDETISCMNKLNAKLDHPIWNELSIIPVLNYSDACANDLDLFTTCVSLSSYKPCNSKKNIKTTKTKSKKSRQRGDSLSRTAKKNSTSLINNIECEINNNNLIADSTNLNLLPHPALRQSFVNTNSSSKEQQKNISFSHESLDNATLSTPENTSNVPLTSDFLNDNVKGSSKNQESNFKYPKKFLNGPYLVLHDFRKTVSMKSNSIIVTPNLLERLSIVYNDKNSMHKANKKSKKKSKEKESDIVNEHTNKKLKKPSTLCSYNKISDISLQAKKHSRASKKTETASCTKKPLSLSAEKLREDKKLKLTISKTSKGHFQSALNQDCQGKTTLTKSKINKKCKKKPATSKHSLSHNLSTKNSDDYSNNSKKSTDSLCNLNITKDSTTLCTNINEIANSNTNLDNKLKVMSNSLLKKSQDIRRDRKKTNEKSFDDEILDFEDDDSSPTENVNELSSNIQDTSEKDILCSPTKKSFLFCKPVELNNRTSEISNFKISVSLNAEREFSQDTSIPCSLSYNNIRKRLLSDNDSDSDNEHSFKRRPRSRKSSGSSECYQNEEADKASLCSDSSNHKFDTVITVKNKEDLLKLINSLCKKGNIDEALKTTKKFLPLHTEKNVQVTIFNELFSSFMAYIKNTGKLKIECHEAVQNLVMIPFEYSLFELCSTIIVNCMWKNCLNPFMHKVLKNCMQQKVSLTKNAVLKSVDMVVSSSNITFQIDFLNYLSTVCKLPPPPKILQSILKEVISTESITIFEKVVIFLLSASYCELYNNQLSKCFYILIKKGSWKLIGDLFKSHNKYLINLLFYIVSTDLKNSAKMFSSIVSNTHGHCKVCHQVLCAIGIHLMMSTFQENYPQASFRILWIFHTHKINYFELSIPSCELVFAPSFSKNNFRSIDIAKLIKLAIDVCLHFNRIKDAYNIFKEIAWDAVDELTDKLLVLKFHLMKKFSNKFLKVDNLIEGNTIFGMLLDASKGADLERFGISNEDLNFLLNAYIVKFLNANMVYEASLLYKSSDCLENPLVHLHDRVLRGLVITFYNTGLKEDASTLFAFGQSQNVYKIETPCINMFPKFLTIITIWAPCEIKLAITFFLKKLSESFDISEAEQSSKENLSIKIKIETCQEPNGTDFKLNCLNISPGTYAAIKRTQTAVNEIFPELSSCNNNNLSKNITITSEAVYNYLRNGATSESSTNLARTDSFSKKPSAQPYLKVKSCPLTEPKVTDHQIAARNDLDERKKHYDKQDKVCLKAPFLFPSPTKDEISQNVFPSDAEKSPTSDEELVRYFSPLEGITAPKRVENVQEEEGYNPIDVPINLTTKSAFSKCKIINTGPLLQKKFSAFRPITPGPGTNRKLSVVRPPSAIKNYKGISIQFRDANKSQLCVRPSTPSLTLKESDSNSFKHLLRPLNQTQTKKILKKKQNLEIAINKNERQVQVISRKNASGPELIGKIIKKEQSTCTSGDFEKIKNYLTFNLKRKNGNPHCEIESQAQDLANKFVHEAGVRNLDKKSMRLLVEFAKKNT